MDYVDDPAEPEEDDEDGEGEGEEDEGTRSVRARIDNLE